MNVETPAGFDQYRPADLPTAVYPGYMSGFGNTFETEALPGALPIGMNSPQKVNYGLYAEQLSGSPFTAPQAAQRALVALPHPPDREAFRALPQNRQGPDPHRAGRPRRERAPHRPAALVAGAHPGRSAHLRDGAAHDHHGRRCRHAGRHGRASRLGHALHGATSISSTPTASIWSWRKKAGCASAPSSASSRSSPARSA